MRFLILVVLFGLMVFSIYSYGDFDIEINDISAGRGSLSDGVLNMGNCNFPTQTQNTVLSVGIVPPDECDGLFTIHFSYYDPYEEKYVDLDDACHVSSSDNCEIMVHLWYGGRPKGTDEYRPWLKARGVCESNDRVYLAYSDLKVNHFPGESELKFKAKLDVISEELDKISGYLSKCECCDDYASTYISYQNKYKSLSDNLKRCYFKNWVSEVSTLSNNLNSLSDAIRKKECNDVVEDINSVEDDISSGVDQVVGDIQDGADDASDAVEEAKDIADETADKVTGGCLSLFMFLGLILSSLLFKI